MGLWAKETLRLSGEELNREQKHKVEVGSYLRALEGHWSKPQNSISLNVLLLFFKLPKT